MKKAIFTAGLSFGIAFAAHAAPRAPDTAAALVCGAGQPTLSRSSALTIDATLLPKAVDCCRSGAGCAQLLSTTKFQLPRHPART